MSRNSRFLLLLIMATATAVLIWGFSRRTTPPEVPFVKVTRETVISALNTNGKVEPIEWASARAERQGVVEKIFVQRGQNVAAGDPLVELDTSTALSQLAAANAQIAQAKEQELVITQGGPQAQRTQIENELSAARLSLRNEQREFEALQRLVAKQAATRVDLEVARQRVEATNLEIQGLEKRRAALVTSADLPVARAKLNEAQAAAEAAQRLLSQSVVRAPISGVLYQFDLRIGSFLDPGDLVGNVGQLDKVRVVVYVDEPDLGRVEKRMPVTITWDALPGRQWKGEVDKLPTQIVPLGSRQVGEVSCIINNPDHDLLPGTNINAEIQSRVVTNALTIPKEAIRREGDTNGVFVLSGEKAVWKPLKLGVASYTKTQVAQGLADGDSIMLPTDKAIKSGQRVRPKFQ